MHSGQLESKDTRSAEFEKFYAEILASPLDPKIKTDVHKNVQCWIYIDQHFNFIKDAVDDWVQYPEDEKLKADDQYYPYARKIKHDKKNGLLRTPEQLSFHIQDYKDGANAASALNNHLEQIASALKQLSAEDRIIFGLMLEWNKQVGCMEARSERALAWASRKLSGMTPLLKDIISEIGALYNISSKEKPFIDFAEEYCRRRKYTQCIDDEQQLKDISKKLLQEYGVLVGLVDEEKKEEKPSALAATYKSLTQSATVVLGGTGTMIKHCFSDKNQAKKFLQWAREQKHLPLIEKVSVLPETFNGKPSFVVRLSIKQLEIIDKEQLKLMTTPPSAVAAATVPQVLSSALAPERKRPLVVQSPAISQRSDDEIKQLWEKLQDAIYCHNAKKVTELMTGVSEQEQIRLLTNPGLGSLLHLALTLDKIGDTCFIALFNSLSIVARKQALMIQDTTKKIVLGHVAQRQNHLPLPGDLLRRLIEETDATAINEELRFRNNYYGNNAFLHNAAQNLPGDICRALLEKADVKAINRALTWQNKKGETPLHLATWNQPGDVFRLLIEKADTKTLSQALFLQDDKKETPLHLAAWKQPGDVFRLLIEKADIDIEVINQVLPMQNDTGETVLHVAALYQLSDAFINLIERCSHPTPDALNKACCLYNQWGQSILEGALPYQSPQAIAKLLNVINDDALKAMLKVPNIPSRLLAAIAGYLGHESSWQMQPLVGRLFALAGPQLTKYCIKLWFTGKLLSPLVVEAALPHFKTLIRTQPQRAAELEAIANYFQKTLPKEEKIESKEKTIFIRLQSGESLELKDENKDAEILWKQGLQSPYEYHLLKKHFPNSLIAQTADELYQAGLLFKGSILPFEATVINPRLAQTNAKGEALLKIIKPKDWPEFKKQISDYHYRAPLRDPKQDKTEATDKYIHKLGTTLSALGKEFEVHKDKKKDHQHTKKQSTSSVSTDYSTSVFGEHDPNRELVGLLFDKEHCIIKAMMLRDTGTFGRKWVGSKEQVAKYMEEIKGLNYTNFEEFKKAIAENPHRLNEVLAKLSHQAILGVTFVTDTPEARKQAREYHDDIKKARGIDVPIYFYDRALRAMRLYTPREQRDDVYAEVFGIRGYNSIREEDAMQRAQLRGEKFEEKLLAQDEKGNTGLHRIAEINPSKTTVDSKVDGNAFRKFIEIADSKFLNQALSLINKNGQNVVLLAAINQPEDVFCQLIEKADSSVINQTLALEDRFGYQFLLTASTFSDDTFTKLIARCSPEALSKACLSTTSATGSSIMEALLSRKSPESIAQLLNVIDDDALKFILNLPNRTPQFYSRIAQCLISEPSWQQQPLAERILALGGQPIADAMTAKLQSNAMEKLYKILHDMPKDKAGFIELLKLYSTVEKDRPVGPKPSWLQTLWQSSPSKDTNLSAAEKMIGLLEEKKLDIRKEEFDALKSGNLGKIIGDMKTKKLLPETFMRQEPVSFFGPKKA